AGWCPWPRSSVRRVVPPGNPPAPDSLLRAASGTGQTPEGARRRRRTPQAARDPPRATRPPDRATASLPNFLLPSLAEPLHIVDGPLPVVVDELEGAQRGHPQGGRRVSSRWIPQSELGIDVLRQAPEHEIHETPRPLGIGPALDDRHAPDLRGGVRGEDELYRESLVHGHRAHVC